METEGDPVADNSDNKNPAGNEKSIPNQKTEIAPAKPGAVEIPKPIGPGQKIAETGEPPKDSGHKTTEMNPFERSTLRWAKLAVILSGTAALFVCLQWCTMKDTLSEMKTSGATATDQIWRAIGNMNWMARTADGSLRQTQLSVEQLSKQAGDTHDLANQTKIIANQATVQAQAAKVGSEAARSAAQTAIDTLHISERAYLILGIPVDDFEHNRINVPIINSGRVPSGLATIVVHEATFTITDASIKIIPLDAVVERHWRVHTHQTIPAVPSGNLISMEVHLPAAAQDQITSGKQVVLIAAVMTYNDGFPGTPEEKFLFCDASTYTASSKLFAMRPCDDPNGLLSKLAALDKYPSTEYQETN